MDYNGCMDKLKVRPGRLRDARMKALLTQEELAESSGVSVPTIQRMERQAAPGQEVGVFPKTLRKLAKALSVEPSTLILTEDGDSSEGDSESALAKVS